jgi:hypothetical protein
MIFSWYSNTLRLRVIDSVLRPAHFDGWSEKRLHDFRDQRPPGLRFAFAGEDVTLEMNGYRPGFDARYYPDTDRPPAYGDQYVLAVRPWLPTLLSAALPLLWLYRYLNATSWQFGLRQAFLAVSIFAVVLWIMMWLKN